MGRIVLSVCVWCGAQPLGGLVPFLIVLCVEQGRV